MEMQKWNLHQDKDDVNEISDGEAGGIEETSDSNNDERDTWGNQMEFLISCHSYSVKLYQFNKHPARDAYKKESKDNLESN